MNISVDCPDCQGDSGGPLTVDIDGVHTLAGVISHGLSGDSDTCGQVTLSVKTNLSVICERSILVPMLNNGNHFLTESCYY